jgi:ParB/RepB/Spo0J family partition protein
MIRVELTRIDDNPYQSRLEYGDLTDLAVSFLELCGALPETSGLLQVPLARLVLDGRVVDPLPGDVAAFLAETPARVELAIGHRRKRAFAQLAARAGAVAQDFTTFPVTLAVLDDQAMAALAWEENEKRKDISDVERAVAIEKALHDFAWTQAEIGSRWGIAQGTVSNLLRLLALPEKIKGLICAGTITGRHGRALLPLVDMGERWETFVHMVEHGGSGEYVPVAEVERRVTEYVQTHTYDLTEIPWDEAWDPRLAETQPCATCMAKIKVGRETRCTQAGCYTAKTRAYKVTVKGPANAVKSYHLYRREGWRETPDPGWATCLGCGRTARDLEAARYGSRIWLRSGGNHICPQCAALGQLRATEPERGRGGEGETGREGAGAEYFPATPPPAYAETGEPGRSLAGVFAEGADAPGDPDAGFTAGVDEDGDGFGKDDNAAAEAPASAPQAATSPTLPAPGAHVVYTGTAILTTPPARPAVLTARIMPGAALAARRVIVSIADEGLMPAVLRSGPFENIGILIGEALQAHFPEME